MSVQIPSKPGVSSITAVGSSPNANGGVIAGQALTLEPADSTHPGIILPIGQTIGGNKTFNGSITSNSNNGFILQNGSGNTIGNILNGSNFITVFSDATNSSGFQVITGPTSLVALTINNSQNSVFGGNISTSGLFGTGSNGAALIQGTNTNDSASSGNIGEYLLGVRLRGGATATTNGVYAQIATITLTPGDWDVSGMIGFTGSSSTIASLSAQISTSATSAVAPTNPYGASICQDVSSVHIGTVSGTSINLGNDDYVVAMPTYKANIATATTQQIYLIVNNTFSAGSVSSYGRLTARRAR